MKAQACKVLVQGRMVQVQGKMVQVQNKMVQVQEQVLGKKEEQVYRQVKRLKNTWVVRACCMSWNCMTLSLMRKVQRNDLIKQTQNCCQKKLPDWNVLNPWSPEVRTIQREVKHKLDFINILSLL